MVLVVALASTACQSGVRAGTRCRTTEWGQDATHVLRCQRGRWVRTATKAQVAQLILAVLRSQTTTTTPAGPVLTPSAPVTQATVAPTTAPPVRYQLPTALASGGRHSCTAITTFISTGPSNADASDPRVMCWGDNSSGQLGIGSSGGQSTRATRVVGIGFATSLAAGGAHTCATTTDGSVWCWGANESGQLGSGGSNAATPRQVTGISGAVRVVADGNNTCAIVAAAGLSSIRCWGDNQSGQLGLGVAGSFSSTPVEVIAGTAASLGVAARNVTSAAIGRDAVCALVVVGTDTDDEPDEIMCWGSNTAGKLGTGSALAFDSNPAMATSARRFGTFGPNPSNGARIPNGEALAGGGDTFCVGVVLSNPADPVLSAPSCWGSNASGQFGVPTPVSSPTPVAIPTGGPPGVSRQYAALGRDHGCAVLADGLGGLSCWGAGNRGQLGNGATPASSTPVLVTGTRGPTFIDAQLALGDDHSCGISVTDIPIYRGAALFCWGANDLGQLGHGTRVDSAQPVPVLGL